MTSYVLGGYGIVLASLVTYAIALVIRLRASKRRLSPELSPSDTDDSAGRS